jgi:archaemetzincin
MKTIYLILFYFFLTGCNPDNTHHRVTEKKAQQTVSKQASLIITLQPFSDLSPQLTNYVLRQLRIVYPFCEIKQAITLPQCAYYKPRNRYRADALIDYLAQNTAKGYVTIGLTDKDVSTTKNGVPDWGIMGLGLCPGNACVVSTYRLDKKNLKDQLFKVAIHELGHTQGLPHCDNPTCFMRDAEGKNTTNEEKNFCSKCKAVLIKKGWKFKD